MPQKAPNASIDGGPITVIYDAYPGDGNLSVGAVPTMGVIQTATAGVTAIAPAPAAGYAIKVMSYCVESAGSVAWSFVSPTGTYLTGSMAMTTNRNIHLSGTAGYPLLQAGTAATLYINLGQAIAVGGHITYFVDRV